MPFSAAGGLNALHAFPSCERHHTSCGGLSGVCGQLGILEALTATGLVPYCEGIPVTPKWLTEWQWDVSSKTCIGAWGDTHDQTIDCFRGHWQLGKWPYVLVSPH